MPVSLERWRAAKAHKSRRRAREKKTDLRDNLERIVSRTHKHTRHCPRCPAAAMRGAGSETAAASVTNEVGAETAAPAPAVAFQWPPADAGGWPPAGSASAAAPLVAVLVPARNASATVAAAVDTEAEAPTPPNPRPHQSAAPA